MGTGDAVEMIPNSQKNGDSPPGFMVVGFEVVPCSYQHVGDSAKNLQTYDKFSSPINCDTATLSMALKEVQPVIFSYEVSFVESDIKWPSRWDSYLKMEGARVHWFSILNSLMVVAFLAGIVLVIFLRTVRRDLTRYEELDKEAQAQMNEELSSWKLVVGDVFRAPPHPNLLCVMVAAGYVAVRLWRTINSGDHKGWLSASWRVACFFPVNYMVFDLHSLSGPISAALYLGYSLFMTLAVMLATGTVGFLSSFWFVHYLFSSVKLN
ncbi:hypothetical protein AMTR_s00010p00245480 [Amborella trichopoda]|uniref:Transmembrane 9 superfamily member n=1 Tax=Amborella trichopoda TaxID=13333 RepID=W1NFU3_AMBTC|nr:hypothetical protein AMTR_s00010p00245480 [Amborella trichopoda]